MQQPIMFVVDTGSSWTWVTYDNCMAETSTAFKQDEQEPIEVVAQQEPEANRSSSNDD